MEEEFKNFSNNKIIKMPFGKYKDTEISDVLADHQYIEWLQTQSWVKEQYPVIFQVIQQYNFEEQPTPEHNSMQIKWLNEIYVQKFFIFYMKTFHQFKKKIDFELNELFHAYFYDLVFEKDDIDVKLHFILTSVSLCINLENKYCFCECYKNENWWLEIHSHHCHCKEKRFVWRLLIKQKQYNKINENIIKKKLQYKFFLKDNYLIDTDFSIELKPIISDDYPGILRKMIKKKQNILICQKFQSSVITLEQVKQFFKLSNIYFIVESEFESS